VHVEDLKKDFYSAVFNRPAPASASDVHTCG